MEASRLLFVCLIGLSILVHCKTQEQKPNIVFVLADDQGWSDIGYNNPSVISPTLDTLAYNGVIFNQSTRTALMTGYFTYRTGLQHNVLKKYYPIGVPLTFTLMPKRLKDEGYSTYMVGKWHLGFCKEDYTPNGRGFDHFYGFYNAGQDYYTHRFSDYLDFREDTTPDFSKEGIYSANVFSEKASEYIRNHDRTKPLFLYLAFQNVHGPLQAPQKYIDMYANVTNRKRRIKLGMVTAMDDAVKEVVADLKESDLWNNTLFVFSSDNGGPQNRNNEGNNWPLRGSKKTLWEGGTRAVAFAHGSMLERTGYINNEMMHVVDWYPTFVKLAGGDTDPDMDGMDIWDTISKGDPSPRTEFVYNIDDVADPPEQAIRVGDYKLIVGKAGNPGDWLPPPEHNSDQGIEDGRISKASVMLFNIRDDPTEHNDLAETMPGKVATMTARLEELKLKGATPLHPTKSKASSPRHFGGVYSPGWC
ncbi:arylsulfatase J-like isoform X2 [Glandiceps talaboti]